MLDLLRNLKATGWSGLEGLVGATVARQLGLRARPEGSGRQHGRDVGLFDAEGRSAGIDIETKRYAEGRTVQERELLGEITETMRARPDTRTWIVAATTPVHAAVAEAIVDEGYSRSVDVVVLSAPAYLAISRIRLFGRRAPNSVPRPSPESFSLASTIRVRISPPIWAIFPSINRIGFKSKRLSAHAVTNWKSRQHSARSWALLACASQCSARCSR